jgi:hypothetical protein
MIYISSCFPKGAFLPLNGILFTDFCVKPENCGPLPKGAELKTEVSGLETIVSEVEAIVFETETIVSELETIVSEVETIVSGVKTIVFKAKFLNFPLRGLPQGRFSPKNGGCGARGLTRFSLFSINRGWLSEPGARSE